MHNADQVTCEHPRRQGNVLVLIALSFILIVAFVAFSVDYGYIVLTESELQNSADAAARSGALVLTKGRTAIVTAAKTWAAKNQAAGIPVVVNDSDVELGTWDSTKATFTVIPATSIQTPNAVRVFCQRSTAAGNPLSLFFAPILGTKYANIKVSSIASKKSSNCGLIIGLSQASFSSGAYTQSYYSVDGNYTQSTSGSEGHVCSNGNILISGSSAIYGDAHPGVGMTVSDSSSIGVTGSTDPLTAALVFAPVDFGNVATVNDNKSIGKTKSKKAPLNSNNVLSLTGGDYLALSPGTYYLSGISLTGGSTIECTGTTNIYVTGDIQMSGGTMINGTFIPKNLRIFTTGTTCTLAGNATLAAVVYGPTTQVSRNGNSNFYGAIVAGQLTSSGTGGIIADYSILDDMACKCLLGAGLVQ